MKTKFVFIGALIVSTLIFGFKTINLNEATSRQYVTVSQDDFGLTVNYGDNKIEKIEFTKEVLKKQIEDAQYIEVINRLSQEGYEMIETNTVVTMVQKDEYIRQRIISIMVK